jgi:phosphoglycolate phosphatase-like HAD superfamily hydrolase
MKNLIFDFDGVLGNTRGAVLFALVASGRESDHQSAISNVTNYFSKKPHHARDHTMTAGEMIAEHEWIKKFGTIVHEHGFSLFEEFISEIKQLENARIAVVSSGSQNYVLPAIQQTSLKPTHTLTFEDHHSKEEKNRAGLSRLGN